MNTLIIYASKHGSAEKCSRMLSVKLTGKVDVYNLKAGNIPELAQYDKVIIGGSIYAGRIQKEVTEFCSKNLSNLKNKKIGLFICCIVEKNAEAQLQSSFPQELLQSSACKISFGGELKFSEMGFMEKTLTKMVTSMLSKNDKNLPAIDTKKDMSQISEENIDKFAAIMNNV